MDRIENHPILGETPKRKKVTFSYDGKLLEGYGGRADRYSVEAAGLWRIDIRRRHMNREVCSVR